MNKTLSIFTYHYVRPLEGSRYPGIKGLEVADFLEHLRYLERHHQVISMENLLHVLDGDEEVPDRAALLTFDDGYRDHFDYVLPRLQDYGWQGAFFIPMQPILEGTPLDVNKIHFILAAVPIRDVSAGLLRMLQELRGEYELESDSEYLRRYAAGGRFDGPEVKFVKNMLQYGLPDPVRQRILDRLFERCVGVDEESFARELYMTKRDVADLRAQGMHIGSHGYHHVRLAKLSRSVQESEILNSLKHLGAFKVPKSEWTVCYPYGSFNTDTLEILEHAGVAAAFTTVGAVTDLGDQGRFELKRLDATDLSEEILSHSRAPAQERER